MKIKSLPKIEDVPVESLKPGNVFEWNALTFVMVNRDSGLFTREYRTRFPAFNLSKSVMQVFDGETLVTHHKDATLVLDGSTLEEIK